MGEIDFNLMNIVVQTNFRLISYVPVKLVATTISKSRGYRYTKPYGTCYRYNGTIPVSDIVG